MAFPYSFPFPFSNVTRDQEAQARVLRQLLPPGALWLLESNSVLSKLLLALAGVLSRVIYRARVLVEESDPRTAKETLEDWERLLGLPDEFVTVIPETNAARRQAITQKLVRLGGQTQALYVAIAAACGYTITISENYPRINCRSYCNAAVYGRGWAFAWKVTVQPPAGSALSHAELESIINRAKPAHTAVVFTYL